MTDKKHVAVLMGGWSSEREVSLVSGAAVCKALEEIGHRVTAIDVQRDAMGVLQHLTMQASGKPDVIFNALHGRGGEDGTMQGLLDFMGIPYTHSGVLASALAMDKSLMKTVVSQAGVRCAQGALIGQSAFLKKELPFPPPYVVKPNNEGSSVGVRIVKEQNDETDLLEDGWIYGETVLVEQFIPGHELTVAVLGTREKARALAVTELQTKEAFYDYSAKYSSGLTEHLLPAPLPPEVYQEALRLAEIAYKAIGCQGAARIDFRWDDTQPGTEGLVFLELNSQPGLTPLSLLPEQAAHVGMSFAELVLWMLEHPVCPS